jgi:uncharacterized damage-inducible protein DinB
MTTVLEEALEAWEFTRRGVVSEARNLAERDLAFRPARDSRTAAELLRHVLESGALMAGELSREDGDFQRKSYEALLREHGRGVSSLKTRAQLLAALRRMLRAGAGRIRKAGEIHMLQEIRRFDGKYGTRLAWMHHGIAHEEYHRGQLALYARLVGKTPALTKQIHG